MIFSVSLIIIKKSELVSKQKIFSLNFSSREGIATYLFFLLKFIIHIHYYSSRTFPCFYRYPLTWTCGAWLTPPRRWRSWRKRSPRSLSPFRNSRSSTWTVCVLFFYCLTQECCRNAKCLVFLYFIFPIHWSINPIRMGGGGRNAILKWEIVHIRIVGNQIGDKRVRGANFWGGL